MQSRPLFYIKLFAVLGVVIVLGFYFFHQSKDFLMGPRITVDYPQNGQTLNNPLVSIKGKVLNAATLLVNGHAIITDNFGNFEKKLLLAKGYNIIELSAKDKFGRVIDKKLEVVLR
jgi:hypothetical protein